eukprot:889992-Prorocentrum_minimum.AAC.2
MSMLNIVVAEPTGDTGSNFEFTGRSSGIQAPTYQAPTKIEVDEGVRTRVPKFPESQVRGCVTNWDYCVSRLEYIECLAVIILRLQKSLTAGRNSW